MMPSFEVIEQICAALEIKPSCLFDESASPQNIKSFSKDEYIASVSDRLFKKLKPLIAKETRDAVR